MIRNALNTDTQDLFGLISLCFAEYPGCFVDPHNDLVDLLQPEKCYMDKNGTLWVIEDETGRICACCGVDFQTPDTAELHRLYVRKDSRKKGLAQTLLRCAEEHARRQGARNLILWSDTRFKTAHEFYAKTGFEKLDDGRVLNDISNSSEYGFRKIL